MIKKQQFGALPDGRIIDKYVIENVHGEYVELLNYGAAWHSMVVRDAAGALHDHLLGAADAKALAGPCSEGFVIGRCANRIAYGRFEIDGVPVQLETNSGEHFLHGASGNYAKKFFEAEADEARNAVCFSLCDTGAGGFGCGADVTVRYTFDDFSRLRIDYQILPDGDTVISPTNHAFFCLSGTGGILDHRLWIAADAIAPKGDIGMPVGDVVPVQEGMPEDFRTPKTVGDMIRLGQEQAGPGKGPYGFDTCFLRTEKDFGLAAEICAPDNGCRMRVYTDMPSLILFTPFGREPRVGKYGKTYSGYSAFCLETQFVPNAVNCPQYDSPIVRKGETFSSSTVYQFDTVSGKAEQVRGKGGITNGAI